MSTRLNVELWLADVATAASQLDARPFLLIHSSAVQSSPDVHTLYVHGPIQVHRYVSSPSSFIAHNELYAV